MAGSPVKTQFHEPSPVLAPHHAAPLHHVHMPQGCREENLVRQEDLWSRGALGGGVVQHARLETFLPPHPGCESLLKNVNLCHRGWA